MNRTFEDRPAVREKTPLLVGIVGPSGTGKTFSALRLATGIQRVTGGDIFGIDTEANRMLHYADRFGFRHVPFAPPFAPLDYLAAITHCVKRGSGVVVIDSMSHEHEGPGGVLEMHEAELDRIAGSDYAKRERCNMLAWQKPKSQRRKLINGILQMGVNVICCFRAKEKLKMVTGKQPLNLGWQPIAGEEFVYEMTCKCLLMPGAEGAPTWNPTEPGEKAMAKLPEQFKAIFASGGQLSEEIGERLAEWAAGVSSGLSVEELIRAYHACNSPAKFEELESHRAKLWKRSNALTQKALKKASDEAKERSQKPAAESGVELDSDGVPILFDNDTGKLPD